ncbi:MAG: oxidoreductase [Bacteroidetes bacterium]|nr:MAG: oxidoreductase [Bacteroidota bacterium]
MHQNLSADFKDYELIDCGNGYKLERFGKFILSRPEPQALWKCNLSEKEWNEMADAHFERDKSSPEKGLWTKKKNMPDQWKISYNNLIFRLGLTGFKHVGVFPEQAANWDFIQKKVSKNAKILNLFAYTGGASLAAKAAGADVTHVDSVQQVMKWGKENMELSSLENIRWVTEDAAKFVAREVRRGNLYDGIILDPPAYGRGPDGEKWILEDMLDAMLADCAKLLQPKNSFLILNLYAMGFSSLLAETLVKTHFKNCKEIETGELFFTDRFEKKLPLSIYTRFIT